MSQILAITFSENSSGKCMRRLDAVAEASDDGTAEFGWMPSMTSSDDTLSFDDAALLLVSATFILPEWKASTYYFSTTTILRIL